LERGISKLTQIECLSQFPVIPTNSFHALNKNKAFTTLRLCKGMTIIYNTSSAIPINIMY
jgi:hypothetical protein